MKILLNRPQTFSEQGQKTNQEDRVAPSRAEMSSSTRCFVLCDGMGGHEQGEVAAEIVCRGLYESLTGSKEQPDIITPERFKDALAVTNSLLDKMPVGEGKRPGTTMTCLYFGENGVLAAHIGDSRIYQVRPGVGIIFKSRDHSLVNDLLRAGELTEEEAVDFPRKNVITRAMQPGLERPYRADISMLTDIKAGDCFFMCCDGILEQLSDERLVQIVNSPTGPEEKIQEVFDVCFNKTRDNYTCILISVEKVEGSIGQNAGSDGDARIKEVKVSEHLKGSFNSKNRFLWPLILIIVALLATVIIYFLKDDAPEEPASPAKKVMQSATPTFERKAKMSIDPTRPENEVTEIVTEDFDEDSGDNDLDITLEDIIESVRENAPSKNNAADKTREAVETVISAVGGMEKKEAR